MKQYRSSIWLITGVCLSITLFTAYILYHLTASPYVLLAATLAASFLLMFAFLTYRHPQAVGPVVQDAALKQGGAAFADPASGLASGPIQPQSATAPPPPEAPKDVGQSYEDFPIAVLRISPDDRVSYCNRVGREYLGLSRDETPRFDDLVTGLGRSVPAWINSYRNSGKSSVPEMLETRRDTPASVLQVSLIDSHCTPEGTLLATLSDATQLQSLQAQFVQSQKMQAIGQLAGGVAHDFNNLLTAISGYCDLLMLRHEQGDPDFGDLIQISQNANRAAALVGQLLAFSRKQTLQPQVINVNNALSDLSHLLNRLVGEKVHLNTVYGRDLPDVFVDGRQLEQVIMNLVVNARDAMQPGGEVEIISGLEVYQSNTVIQKATVPAGRYVSIQVRDTGCGIRKDQLHKIFDPFYSTKKAGEGTGLGLSMVYGIIKQTGGFIFVESKPGQGTVFTILLPEYDGREVVAEPVSKSKKPAATVLNGLCVLLVEDEAPVRAFAARALNLHGVDVTEAESAERALEILENPDQFVDIIVSDVVMPGMDGPTWVRKALETRPDTKVIFVSGYAEEAFSQQHTEIRNAVFLPKPFSLKQLIETVRELSR
jgi:two-component system cell cycle sensor histidine kinase/response regulator CckA